MNRRNFFRNAAAFPLVARSTVLGANDRINIGFIGLGGRAKYLLGKEDFGGNRVVAISDCWSSRLDEASALQPPGVTWNKYPDYRRMFEREKLDAVFIETTTHARVLIAIEAMQAGFDVYAEKPVCLTIEEGRTLVKAAHHYKRVVQAGTQQRSMPINIYASKLVASGKLGKIEKVVVCNFIGPAGWKPLPEEKLPEGLDWDQWCNQTELRPYHTQLHKGGAKWWDYDGGGLSWGVSGWGTHSLDQVQAALGTSHSGPLEVWQDEPGQDKPVHMRYASGTIVSLEQPIIKDHQQLGAIFIGSKGRMQIVRGDFNTDMASLRKGAPDATKEGPGECVFHLNNFFDCVKTRKMPNADVETAHRSTTVCSLVNICRDLGRKFKWNPNTERFKDDDEANSLLSRPRRKGFELPSIAL
jgi:predicted dehydrogenase